MQHDALLKLSAQSVIDEMAVLVAFGNWFKCRMSGPTPDLLKQSLYKFSRVAV
jgi:hypothetical protein